MKVRWLARARRDLALQLDYIVERQPRAAIVVEGRVLDAVARLSLFPMSGREGRVSGTRELVVSGSVYIVIYDVADHEVRILRIIHSAQDYPPTKP